MMISLTRADGGSVGVNPGNVSEINRGKNELTWVCFKGGGAMAVKDTVEKLATLFVPPLVKLEKLNDGDILVSPECIQRVEQGVFHGAPCVWIGYAPEHERKAVALATAFSEVFRLLNYRRPELVP